MCIAGPSSTCIRTQYNVHCRPLQPGTYHFSLDSFVSSNGAINAGQYLFVILACHPDDTSCEPQL